MTGRWSRHDRTRPVLNPRVSVCLYDMTGRRDQPLALSQVACSRDSMARFVIERWRRGATRHAGGASSLG